MGNPVPTKKRDLNLIGWKGYLVHWLKGCDARDPSSEERAGII